MVTPMPIFHGLGRVAHIEKHQNSDGQKHEIQRPNQGAGQSRERELRSLSLDRQSIAAKNSGTSVAIPAMTATYRGIRVRK